MTNSVYFEEKYTERQKTYHFFRISERRSLKPTTSKCIIFGHGYAVVFVMRHIGKFKGILLSDRRKCGEIAKGHLKVGHISVDLIILYGVLDPIFVPAHYTTK